MRTARVFMHGSSHAIHIPAEYRFEKPDVCMTRLGSMVVIYTKDEVWDLFASAIGSVGEDFKRLDQGEHERDLAALDPTPAPMRTRVARKAAADDGTPKTSATRRRRSV